MLRYRCYLLGEKSQVLGAWDFEAASSEEAIAAARKLTLEEKARGFELWEATKFLHNEAC